MSEMTISMPKEWNKEITLAVLDAWIEALDRGYTLSIKREGKEDINQ